MKSSTRMARSFLRKENSYCTPLRCTNFEIVFSIGITCIKISPRNHDVVQLVQCWLKLSHGSLFA
ncbi:hypothetical protein Plhal304r1_c016g0058671 [Plasmopara halstedii]